MGGVWVTQKVFKVDREENCVMENRTDWQHAPGALGGWQWTELRVATPMALASQWPWFQLTRKQQIRTHSALEEKLKSLVMRQKQVPGLLAAFKSKHRGKISSITERQTHECLRLGLGWDLKAVGDELGPPLPPCEQVWEGLGRAGQIREGHPRARKRAFPPTPQMWPGSGCVGGDLMLKPTVKAGLGRFCTNTVITCPPSSGRKWGWGQGRQLSADHMLSASSVGSTGSVPGQRNKMLCSQRKKVTWKSLATISSSHESLGVFRRG